MIIKVENLTKTYITYKREHTFWAILKSIFKREKVLVEALKSITFNIEKGELVGFLGPNGAGKSTTIKILSGILFPTSGVVDSYGYVPWLMRKKYVAHIGAVFGQKSQLIWDIPAIDSFYMNQAIYNIKKADFKKRLNKMVNMLEVNEIIKKPTRQLSLGERMRCEFIMAMLHNPKIVFLDEPTIGLDVVAKEKIRIFIKEMNEKGVTFILTTHDMDDVEHLAKRVIVINHGEIVFDGKMSALKNYLGTKKIVRLATHERLPKFDKRGVENINIISNYEAEFELDMARIELNNFIKLINENNTIRDISIHEPPIETVVKKLYE
jgi:ABC-2 type transport system ATP-binding protein